MPPALSLIAFLMFSSVASAATVQIVQFGYTNAQGAKIPVFLGKEQGIFERHGLDLHLSRVSPGTQGVPKLLAGEIQLFLGNSGPVVEAVAAQRAPLVVIASLGIERFAIYTKPEITAVKELKGKTFGVSTSGASQDRIATRALKKLGFELPKDVRVVATALDSSVERLRSLIKGDVDAVSATAEDFAQLTVSETAKIRKLIDLTDLGIFVSGADVSVTRGYIEAHREAVRQFLQALEESLRLAKEKPDLIAAAYKKYGGISDPQGLQAKVREYYAGNPPERPLPNKKAVENHLEELKEKYPDLKLRDVSAYIDESLY